MSVEAIAKVLPCPVATSDPEAEPAFERRVESLKRRFAALWWHSSAAFPELEKVSEKGRRANEREIEASMDEVENRLRSMPATGTARSKQQRELRESLRNLARRKFRSRASYADVLLSDDSFDVTTTFLEEARVFNPALRLEDLYQALRNVWIMNSLQLFLDQPIAYTPSIFGYSMLYPYTDNPLDDASIDPNEKARSGRRLRDRLAGLTLSPSSSHEAEVFRLIGMIEAEHPRSLFPDVYESLLAIHRAQMKSLGQQRHDLSPYETDLLALSLEKGGTSVLADAYLVAPRLDADEEAFHFGFGVVLQLLDDAQDVAGDKKAGHQTLFSQTAGRWPLDPLMNRLFHFLDQALVSADCLSPRGQEAACDLIQGNCTFSIMQAVAENPAFVSKTYYRALEQYSPLRFSYLRGLRRALEKRSRRLEKRLPRGGIMAAF